MEQKDLMGTVRDAVNRKIANDYDNTVLDAFEKHGYSKEEILDPKNRERITRFKYNSPSYECVEDWCFDNICLFRLVSSSKVEIGENFKVTTEYHVLHYREPIGEKE